jgi:bifunctional DNA-binding transcriptional regulator/antitoxin component of YhaV-PrlF toxin-antitoxin module
MAQRLNQVEVPIEPQGNAVIPAELCKAIGGLPGETLIAHVEDGRLVLEERKGMLARLRSRFATLPADISLSDELIRERRAEVRKEQERESV